MESLEVSGAVRPIYGSLGFKRLKMGSISYAEKSVTTNLSRVTSQKSVNLTNTAAKW